jgi:hypothetical protein
MSADLSAAFRAFGECLLPFHVACVLVVVAAAANAHTTAACYIRCLLQMLHALTAVVPQLLLLLLLQAKAVDHSS